MNKNNQSITQEKKQREIFNKQIQEDVGELSQINTLKLDNWMQSYLNRIFKALTKISSTQQTKILDIGCGAKGYIPITSAIHKKFSQSYGIEISLEACKYAKAFSQKTLTENFPHFIQCSAHQLGFRNESFEAVTCIALLEHIVEDNEVIQESARVLKKNGYLYLMVPNDYKNIPFFLRWYYKKVDKKMGHLRHYNRKILKEKLEAAGFEDLQFYTTGHIIKMFQYFLTIIYPKINTPDSKVWWYLEKLDLKRFDNDKGVSLSVLAKKNRREQKCH